MGTDPSNALFIRVTRDIRGQKIRPTENPNGSGGWYETFASLYFLRVKNPKPENAAPHHATRQPAVRLRSAPTRATLANRSVSRALATEIEAVWVTAPAFQV